MTIPTAPRAEGWSKLSVRLHWLIVLLIVVQFIDHEWMVDMWRASRRGTEIDQTTAVMGWLHIVTGALVLVATGLLAWFGGIGFLAEAHELMWTPLLVLVAIHIAGALAQHFWFKTDVLKRMVTPAAS